MDGVIHPEVAAVAQTCSDQLARLGAQAVVLVGSHARGNAHPESDIDLHAIGVGPPYQLTRREPFLVSVSWQTVEAHRSSFVDIDAVGSAVPAWRSARILYDPDSIAHSLQTEARAWTWISIGPVSLDAHVADAVTGFAEEVQKLQTALNGGRFTTAAVQRSVLALRLAFPMSIHHRLLYDTENALWDMVNDAMGTAWTAAQRAAFGLNGESLEQSSSAAIRLFEIACDTLWKHMTGNQRAVVNHALAMAGRHVKQDENPRPIADLGRSEKYPHDPEQ